jgi:hypothetical protein
MNPYLAIKNKGGKILIMAFVLFHYLIINTELSDWLIKKHVLYRKVHLGKTFNWSLSGARGSVDCYDSMETMFGSS